MSLKFKFEHSYLNLSDVLYHENSPQLPSAPELLLWNGDLALSLGAENISDCNSIGNILSGALLPKGAKSVSLAYAGHQFGHFTILGDGRAHLLGEHRIPNGQIVDIQLKGSGRSKFSRGGDGRAALGPMLREYLMSEALYGLGIPTTRSLAVCLTGDMVKRETLLPGAVLTRIAASHIRVGTFEFAASCCDFNTLKALANYTIKRHFPELLEDENPYLSFLDRVMQKQIDLVIDWIRIGFVHGVMNTDNTTISGETIDYGPCAMIDAYHPEAVFSSVDQFGRYAFGNQSQIILWNMSRFAESLLPLIDRNPKRAVDLVTASIETGAQQFRVAELAMYRKKLGIFDSKSDDHLLVKALLDLMTSNGADYTLTFRDIMRNPADRDLFLCQEGADWLKKWRARLGVHTELNNQSLSLMRSVNPAVVPRNHWIERALEEAHNGDLSLCHDLIAAHRDPYSELDKFQKFRELPPTPNQVYQTFCGT